MDPTFPTKVRYARQFGWVGLFLLIAAVVTAALAWLASTRGEDPSGGYRRAVTLGAGAIALGVISWTSSRMDGRASGDES